MLSLKQARPTKKHVPTSTQNVKSITDDDVRRWIKWRESIRGNRTHSQAGIFRCMRTESRLPFETLWLFHLSTKGKVLRKQLCAVGDESQCVINCTDIVRKAKRVGTIPIIITVHNHPEGACRPSSGDRKTWKLLRKECDRQGVLLLDNMIVNGRKYYSELNVSHCH